MLNDHAHGPSPAVPTSSVPNQVRALENLVKDVTCTADRSSGESHALPDNDQPSTGVGEHEDGMLEAREIMNLDLKAELVV